MYRDTEKRARKKDAGDRPPRVADASKSGTAVSATTWSGRQPRGTVSDREQAGLLLELAKGEDGTEDHVYSPWSSVEQVGIPGVTRRPVKPLLS